MLMTITILTYLYILYLDLSFRRAATSVIVGGKKNYASLSRQLDVVSIAKYPTAGGVGGCCGGSLKEDYRARHHLRTGTHRSISQ